MAESLDAKQLLSALKALQAGDLSVRMPEGQTGEAGEVAREYNRFLDRMQTFTSELKRIHREVGTEARFGGQAEVEGLSGVWKELVDSTNRMAGNLTDQLRNICQVVTVIAKGDLTKKITVDVDGELLELKNTINLMVDRLNSFASEVTRIAREVGTEGKLGGQAEVKGVAGIWKDLLTNVNLMAENLTIQVRSISKVTSYVANGDLSHKIAVNVRGEMLELKVLVNTMVDRLNAFASEVARVSEEICNEGRSGSQIQLEQLCGVWKELVDDINAIAARQPPQGRSSITVV
jgi:HAMP domain-containing protein